MDLNLTWSDAQLVRSVGLCRVKYVLNPIVGTHRTTEQASLGGSMVLDASRVSELQGRTFSTRFRL